MFNRQKNKLNIQEIESKLKEISHKLDQLEQSSRQNIYIETVNIDHPSLEKLTFTLDKLDIKELSGSLNLGNNFGTQIGQDMLKKLKEENKDNKERKGNKNNKETQDRSKEKADKSKETAPRSPRHTNGSRIKKTSTGFSILL